MSNNTPTYTSKKLSEIEETRLTYTAKLLTNKGMKEAWENNRTLTIQLNIKKEAQKVIDQIIGNPTGEESGVSKIAKIKEISKEELLEAINNLGNNELKDLFGNHKNKYIKSLTSKLSENNNKKSPNFDKIKTSLDKYPLEELEICKILIDSKDFGVNGKEYFIWNDAIKETKEAGKNMLSEEEGKYIFSICKVAGVKPKDYFNREFQYYWSSSIANSPNHACVLDFDNIATNYYSTSTNDFRVICIR
ncbi:hypothetical protein KAZ01_01560 [Candidatus Gracilibacteria bacterium]|nr:hypothetical protein [Candidatus Gracilibacteria bacterium]